MTRLMSFLGWITVILAGPIACSAGEPVSDARAKIAECIEKDGDQYIGARNWLLEHPEALELLREDVWQERWVKRICDAWLRKRDLYEAEMKSFELGEANARRSVRVGVPDAFHWAEAASRNYGAKDVPLAVECLWKTGRNWRKYKAWRVAAVVQYLNLHGDASVLGPAIDVLATQSSKAVGTSDPGSEYPPRLDPFMRALGESLDLTAPYAPVQLVLEFGDDKTLAELEHLLDKLETTGASRSVLRTTARMLQDRLARKKRGEPLERADLRADFGDQRMLDNLRVMQKYARGEYGRRIRHSISKLENRLEKERGSDAGK